MSKDNHQEEFSTLAAKRYNIRGQVNPVATPIYSSSTFVLDNAAHGAAICNKGDLNGASPFFYTRWANPTNDVAEQAITALEGGHSSFVTASGMAAVSTALLSVLKSGDHLIVPECVYSGTYELVKHVLPGFGIEVTFVDSTDVKNYEAATKPNTKVYYLETPSNPTMAVADLSGVAKLASSSSSSSSSSHPILTFADNTFATPFHTRPIPDHGIVAGSITVANKELAEKVYLGIKLFGAVLAPQASFLLQRGIKTLDVRMQRHSSNALAIAKFLESHPKINKVNYPGLESHPQHALASKQMKNGFGGMLSFEVKGGVEAGRILVETVKVITLAVSLGGVESLIEHPASMTHYSVSKEEREKSGITDGLIRLSVGIEGEKDLIADLSAALDVVSI